MNWLKKYMIGRYGGDQLSIALIVLSMLLALIGNFARLPIIALIGYVPLVLAIFRMLSRNSTKRSMENYKFMIIISPLYSLFIRSLNRLKDLKYYKYFTCPNCKAKLRVPKGKGKIVITCTRCKTEFKGRT